MRKSVLCITLAIYLAFTLLLSPEPVEGAVTDAASPYAYPATYTGNPVMDAGDTNIDELNTLQILHLISRMDAHWFR